MIFLLLTFGRTRTFAYARGLHRGLLRIFVLASSFLECAQPAVSRVRTSYIPLTPAADCIEFRLEVRLVVVLVGGEGPEPLCCC